MGEVLLSWDVSVSTDLNVVYMYLATSICIVFLYLDPLLFPIRFLKILFFVLVYTCKFIGHWPLDHCLIIVGHLLCTQYYRV